jgi:hypothetical protein
LWAGEKAGKRIWAAFLLAILCLSACTPDSARYEERITRLRNEVRANFSPKFDPIWIENEKKAPAARQELARLVAVMDAALTELESVPPPPEMRELQVAHRALFRDCKQALLAIEAEAGQPSPKGMKAVEIYQEMTRRFLEMDERSETERR